MTIAIATGANAGSIIASAGSAAAESRSLGVFALFSWLVSVGSGGYMLGTWVARGGPRQQRARRDGLPPAVIFTHFGLAVTGLALWVAFLATMVKPLALTAALMLVPAVGLGISTLTLWTPYPIRPDEPGAEPGSGPDSVRHEGSMAASRAEDDLSRRLTDDVLANALTDDELAARLADEMLASILANPAAAGPEKSGSHLAALVPALHGIAAVTTILLTALTVVSTLS